MIYLKNIYKRYLHFQKDNFLRNSGKWFGVKEINSKTQNDVFENYYKNSFFAFLTSFKNLLCYENAFDFVKEGWGDNWEFENLISFLKSEKLIEIKGSKVTLTNKKLWELIPQVKNEEFISSTIEKKLKVKINPTNPAPVLFTDDFQPKAEWDQMPISQESALFCVKKIIEYLPLKKTFLFVGDDDFLSVYLGLVIPDVESFVIDGDENLLSSVNKLAKKFNLKIKTKKVDTRKKEIMKGEFTGFLCNPPYTEKGIKSFVKYGMSHLGKNGGTAFLTIGDECIGNRMFFVEDFLLKQNLLTRELISGKISYPYLDLHSEDKDISEKMKKHFNTDIIKRNPRLGADFWILEYLPFEIKRIKTDNSIYSYL